MRTDFIDRLEEKLAEIGERIIKKKYQKNSDEYKISPISLYAEIIECRYKKNLTKTTKVVFDINFFDGDDWIYAGTDYFLLGDMFTSNEIEKMNEIL
jgi:hypothetical protein